MGIFIVRKINLKKIVFFSLLGIVVLIVEFGDISSLLQARVNRSTAMQVTKSVAAEPIIPANSPDFFTEYRLERDKIRSERCDLLRDSIKNAKTDDIRTHAQDTVLKIIMEKQKEAEMENLIRAKGFADALVFIRDNSVSAVVKATSLSREEVIQVAEVISRISGVKVEDISISGKP